MECVKAAYSTEGSTDGRGWLEREIEREYAQIRDAASSDPRKAFTNDDFERNGERPAGLREGAGRFHHEASERLPLASAVLPKPISLDTSPEIRIRSIGRAVSPSRQMARSNPGSHSI